MSSLRDARFEKALASAPDADAAAPAAVRAAIRDAAHRAVAKPSRAPWWTTLLGGEARMPWNAAFATVVLAGFVTLLWRGGGELPQDEVAVERAPVAAQPAPSQPTVEQQAPAPVAPSPSPSPAPAPAPARAPAVVAPQRSAPMRASETEGAREAEVRRDAVAAGKAAAAREQAERRAEAAPSTHPVAPPPPPPPPAAMQVAPAFVPAPQAPAAASPPARFARRSEAPATTGTARPTAATMPAWDTIRIEAGSRVVTLARPQADGLAAAIDGLLKAPREPAGAAPARTLEQFTLLEQARTVGQLWLGESTATWQPAAQPAVTWRPDAAQLAALRELVRQSVGR